MKARLRGYCVGNVRSPEAPCVPSWRLLHQLVATGDVRTTLSAQAAEPTFLMGPPSHTYRDNPINGTITSLTENTVGYLGAADASYPKVGDLYYGAVQIANVSGVGTAVAADIVLPPN